MNSGKKHSRKQKRPTTPILTSQIARRLEKLRNRRRDLWADDSDEEEPRRSRRHHRREKNGRSATCLICSVLSQLSAHNCCSTHLAALQEALPNQVMIIPVTDELIQRYLNPDQIHQLRRSSTSTRKVDSPAQSRPKRAITTMDLSDDDPSAKRVPSPPVDVRPSASSITFEPVRSHPVVIDLESSDEVIEPKIFNPWNPISDDVDATLEGVLNEVETSTVFSPATVRRTETELMAARLPKIPLKPGRFRLGKPISPAGPNTAASEYRPLSASQTRSPPNPSPRPLDVQETPASPPAMEIVLEDTQGSPPMDLVETTISSRLSFRLNPDGSRVSISRPALQANGQSPPPIHSLRRTSTDVTPKQM